MSDSESNSSTNVPNSILQDLPFCLEDLPQHLLTDDPIDQDELLYNLYRVSDPNQTFEHAFETLPIRRLNVTAFERQYKNKVSGQAVSSLRTRTQVVLGKDSIYKHDSSNIELSCSNHFLNFFMAVSSNIGLAAVLPNLQVDHTWTLKLDLNQPFRQWRTNYGKLGFDSAGRMLYAGQKGQESVWFAFAPIAFVENRLEDVPPGQQNKGSSTLHPLRYRRFMMFLNYCLHKMAYEDLTLTTTYPDVSSNAAAGVHSNIL